MDDNSYDNNSGPMNEPIDNYGAPMGAPMQEPMQPIQQPQMQQPMNPYARPTRPMRGYGQRGYGQPMGQPMQPQMQQPMMQSYNQMPYEQPIDPYGPSMASMGSMRGGANSSFKSRLTFVIIMVLVGGLLLAGTFLLPGMFRSSGGSSESKKITYDSVKSYCEKNDMTLNSSVTPGDSEDVEEVVACTKGESLIVGFITFKKPALETEMMKEFNGLNDDDGSVLWVDKSDDYKEFYAGSLYTHLYFIIDKKDLLMIQASDEDDIEKVLTALRGEDSRNSKYKEEKVEDFEMNALQRSQRDTARRNDMSRVDTSLVQYQTNNSNLANNLPGPFSWEGVQVFEKDTCLINTSTNTACNFVRNYMNSLDEDGGKNEFIDPDGTPYNVLITPNWGIYSDLGNLTFNENSKLIEKDDGYTIGGDSPFEEHVIYIIPGGRCESDTVVKSQKRHFAVMYQLEGAGVYCIDDQ